jgi:DNA (cytosine-5)-methyltransferase 1
MSRPICVDLFAGVGGLSLGFEQAGFDVACAVEIDPVACAAHKFNFPETAVICKSAEDVTAADIRASGLGDANVSVVFGGSPCQGFSMMGKRSLDDPRNALVGHFMRIVIDLEAEYFVLENVRGLTIGPHKQFLQELVEGFQAAGYDVLLPWKVLNASSFGVPQNRERLFIVGARRGLALPAYPAAQTRASGKTEKVASGLPFGPSVTDAIGDLPDADDFSALASTDSVETRLGSRSAYAAKLRGELPDAQDYSYARAWDSAFLTSSATANHTELTRSRFAATANGDVEPVSHFLKLDPNGICNTLRAGTGKDRGAFTAARPIHPNHPRCITVREMARLHSYPDSFRFNHTKWHGAREVGNSVPPLLGRAVAAELAKAMGYRPVKPEKTLNKADERLLKVDNTSAKDFFAKNSF